MLWNEIVLNCFLILTVSFKSIDENIALRFGSCSKLAAFLS